MKRIPRQEAAPRGEPVVTEEDGIWIVQVGREGKAQEYRCATEDQARRLAALMRGSGPGTARRPGR